MTRRLVLASILAPSAAVLAAWVGFVATSTVALLPRGQGVADIAEGGWLLLGFFLVFGIPLAAAASLLAIPVYGLLRDSGQLSRRNVILLAAALGGTSVVVIWALMFGVVFGLAQLPSGLLAGAVGGIVFWTVGLRSGTASPAA